jgi:hypothetical protein
MFQNRRKLQTSWLLPAALVAMSPALTGAEGRPADVYEDLFIVNANDEAVTLTEQKTLAPFNRRPRRNQDRLDRRNKPAKVAYGSQQWTLGPRKAAAISMKEPSSPVYVFDLASPDGKLKVKLAIDTYGRRVTLLDAMDLVPSSLNNLC